MALDSVMSVYPAMSLETRGSLWKSYCQPVHTILSSVASFLSHLPVSWGLWAPCWGFTFVTGQMFKGVPMSVTEEHRMTGKKGRRLKQKEVGLESVQES